MKNKITLQKNKRYKLLLLIFISLIIILSFILIGIIKNNNNDFIETSENLTEIYFSSIDDRYILDKFTRKENKIINIKLEAKESKILINGNWVNSYTYNGLSPGPIIRAKVGDTLNATLINNINENTTIHWHGLQVPNGMDGVPHVTQKPVKKGDKFIYTFKLNEPGIYWYHPHVNTAEQVGKGLYGILIVEKENDNIKFDKEQLLILDDIRLDRSGQIAPFGNMMDASMAGRYGNNYFINGKTSFDINADKGSFLKLKLVNTANARIFQFAIENHDFVVLGNDIGRIKNPYETDSLILAPGERAEILIYLNKSNKDKFKILNLATRQPEIIGELIYENEDKSKKEDNLIYYQNLIKENLKLDLPDWSNKLNIEPDITFDLYAINGGKEGFKWTINGGYYPEKPDIQELEEGKFYKLRYSSKQRMIHPMHLHGQKFIILARDGIPVNDTMWRDTALVFPNESVDIGLIAEGKGSWVNHCHILEHAEAGMLGIVNVS